MKVIYINHYGVWGGAQRSMVEMIRNFPREAVNPIVLTPEGRIEHILKDAGIEFISVKGIAKVDHTRVGYYKGWRWIILLRELWYLLFTMGAFLTNRKKFRSADIIHVNENTCIVPVILAKKLYNKKTVMHARAVMNNEQKLFRTRLMGNWFRKYVDVLVAIDENVRESLPYHPRTVTIHNGLTISDEHTVDQKLQDKLKEINKRKLNLGFVGALDKNKGIYDLIEAMKVCIEQNMDVNLYVLGASLESARG
ncbi:MAG TPA: glycosyltransferase, partial [Parasegetibacter sp.]